MTNNRFRTFVAIFAAAFFALGIYAVVVIGKLSFHYDGGGYYGGGVNEDYLAVRIAEEMARQEGKLFAGTSETIVGLDAENLAAEFLFTAIPKEYREGSAARLFYGGQVLPMEWNNGVLEAKVVLPLDALTGNDYRVTIQDGGTYRSEVVWADLTAYIQRAQSVFGFSDRYGYVQQDGKYEGDLVCKLDEALLPFGEKAKSARVYAVEAGEVIYDKPMANGVFDEKFQVKLKRDVTVTVYAEVTGESGLVYRYFLMEMRSGDSMNGGVNYSPTDTAETVLVTAPNGKTLELAVEY